ncbi:MAG: hypothetical protein KIT72_16420, partial [Polyangiaceae bacterium]|nr:hypothetical protein [Polyangiaceae bacterium]MCW5792002.1 hypothetical protein [Polyangiaceae bacterium]
MTSNRTSPHFAATLTLSLVLAGVVGCSESDRTDTGILPPETRLVIQTADRRFESVFPAGLDVAMGSKQNLQLGVSGQAEGEMWATIAWLPMDQVVQGTLDIELGDRPIADGVGNLTLHASHQVIEEATSGSLRATLSKGRIVGDVEVTPGSLSAHFEGELSVSCSIPREPGHGGADGVDEQPGV